MDIRQHPRFQEFFGEVEDAVTKAKLLASIKRLAAGNPGKAKSVGEGVWELKIDYGPGWRIYYTKVGSEIVILLTGGTKNRQQQDIEAAKQMAREIGR
ncbi:type II toxin-antitoxin system RelE/ParE family toxin [Massilia sp.]|uniref:type II toxin-antitoxin system RelE/ParE family toxin n=1 Tax=Massilia sp. TaxID=1882437 RepID=UPI0028980B0E|nr:type II toxin-antitoxin system RelE/ParE family toxin [Massilia sp.]